MSLVQMVYWFIVLRIFLWELKKNITEERNVVLYLFLNDDFLRCISLLGTSKRPSFFNRKRSFEIVVHILVSKTKNTLV